MRAFLLAGIALALLGQARPLGSAESDMPKLLKGLESPLKANRLKAMQALGDQGTAARDAIPALAKHLRHKDKDLAGQAARSLAQVGPAAVPELLKALQDPAPEVRPRALWALGVLGPEAGQAVGPVGAFLKDGDAKVRALAAWVLGEMGPAAAAAAPLLARALRDPDPQVRARAAEALHDIGQEMVSHLLPVAKDDDLAVRLNAVQALVTFHESKAALAALVGALRDPAVQVRAAVAGALARLGPEGKAALPALLECLKGGSRELQTQAFTAIMAIAAPEDAELRDALSALNEKGRWAGAPAPKQPGAKPTETVKRLLRCLGDPNGTRRLGAVLALGDIGPGAKEALPSLMKSLKDPERSVRAAAVLALAAVDPRRKLDVKQADDLIGAMWADLKAAKKPDAEELVQFHLLVSTLSWSGWAGGLVDEALKKTIAGARE